MLKKTDSYQINQLSREIAKVHKSLFGKGPNWIDITICASLVVIKAEGVLTLLENNLLETENGEKTVCEIRKVLVKKYRNDILGDLREIIGNCYSEISVELFVDTDELIIVLC